MANPYKNDKVRPWRLIFANSWRCFGFAFVSSLVYAMISCGTIPAFREDAATREFKSFDQLVAGQEPVTPVGDPRIEWLARGYHRAFKTGDFGEAKSAALELERLCRETCTTEEVVNPMVPNADVKVEKCVTDVGCTPEIGSVLHHHRNLKSAALLDSSMAWQKYMRLYDKPMLRWRYRYAIFLACAFVFFKFIETLVASVEVRRRRRLDRLYERVEGMVGQKPFGRAYRVAVAQGDMSKGNLRRILDQGVAQDGELEDVRVLVHELELEEKLKKR